MTILNVVVFIAILIFPILITLRIFRWQWRPNTRPCKLFGHDKKYVAIRTYSVVPMGATGRPLTCSHSHKIGEKGIYEARWSCRRCPMMGEDCLGNKQDWTIEHEKLVPDVKKWANWSQDPPLAWEKLRAIQERLDAHKDPPLVTVKTELVKGKNYCGTCGWNHDGPCLPLGEGRKPHDTKIAEDLEALRKSQELRDCTQCGAQHRGPCVPGGIS